MFVHSVKLLENLKFPSQGLANGFICDPFFRQISLHFNEKISGLL